MTSLVINAIKCNETSGGKIQLMVGNQPILPDYIEFISGEEKFFGLEVDLGEIIGATVPIKLYDSRFSNNQSIDEFVLTTQTSIESFNYDKNRWSDEELDYVRIYGNYDVVYQVKPSVIQRVRFPVISWIWKRNLQQSVG